MDWFLNSNLSSVFWFNECVLSDWGKREDYDKSGGDVKDIANGTGEFEVLQNYSGESYNYLKLKSSKGEIKDS